MNLGYVNLVTIYYITLRIYVGDEAAKFEKRQNCGLFIPVCFELSAIFHPIVYAAPSGMKNNFIRV